MSRLLQFLVGPVFVPNGRPTEYYDLLGVKLNASTSDVKKAFQKKSLYLHPDKVTQRGEEINPEHFIAIRQAYEVLIDSEKRKIYDRLGPVGLQLYENPTSINISEIASNFQSSKISYRCRLYLIFLIIFGFFLLFPILLCLKMNQKINIQYVQVWIPLWVFQALFFWGATIELYESIKFYYDQKKKRSRGHIELKSQTIDDDESDDFDMQMIQYSTFEKIKAIILFGLIVTAQIFFTLQLDHLIHWDWFLVLSPIFLLNGLNMIISIVILSQKLPNDSFTDCESNDLEKQKIKYIRIQARNFQERNNLFHSVFQVCFLLLLGFKLTNDHLSWWTVFIPVWIWLGLKLCFCCCSPLIKQEVGGQKLQSVGICCSVLSNLFFAVMFSSWLSTHGFSAFYIFLPMFIAYCCILSFFTRCILCPTAINESKNDIYHNTNESSIYGSVNQDGKNVKPFQMSTATSVINDDNQFNSKQSNTPVSTNVTPIIPEAQQNIQQDFSQNSQMEIFHSKVNTQKNLVDID